jgi:hypothetical protein
MLEVSRDAVAAGEEQLVSCAAEPSKYISICTVLDPCGDLPFTSWSRGGDDVGRFEQLLCSPPAVGSHQNP